MSAVGAASAGGSDADIDELATTAGALVRRWYSFQTPNANSRTSANNTHRRQRRRARGGAGGEVSSRLSIVSSTATHPWTRLHGTGRSLPTRVF